MPAGNLGHEDVKKICDNLECSPSQHDASGNYGGAPNISPTAKNSGSVTPGSTPATKEFQMKDRSNKISGYSGRFAKGARQE